MKVLHELNNQKENPVTLPIPTSGQSRRSIACSILAVALAGLAFLATPDSLLAQEKAGKQDLPPELAIVPQGALGFIYLRPSEIWQSEPVAKLRQLFPQETAEFLKSLGDDPAKTESLIAVFPMVDGS